LTSTISEIITKIFTVRWKPNRDLAVVAASWLLVVGALYSATAIIGVEAGGGIPYFILYAVVGALIFGVGIPLGWMVIVRKRPLADLGLTFRWWRISLTLQLVFAATQFITGPKFEGMAFSTLVPLLALVLTIGFFEALFWRGWVLLRLEEAFGIIPAILLGSLLYAAYHIGYAMTVDEMVFLFFIGIMFAVAFRITGSILVLWPIFQPMGQLITLTQEGLTLPLISALGFVDVLVVMLVFIWLARRYYKKHIEKAILQAERSNQYV
jgi:hypothetical protein